MTLKQKIHDTVLEAVNKAQKNGAIANAPLPEIIIERPQNTRYGDYASSLPLKISRSIGMDPLSIATKIKEFIPSLPEIENVSVLTPGFINFTIKHSWLAGQVNIIINSGSEWGNVNIGNHKRVQVEFVSVNPTGPLHVGHGRGAVLGSVLSNVLNSAGYEVEKEYYINDAGNQLETFKRSLYIRYQQNLGKTIDMPEDGYMGTYVVDLIENLSEKLTKRQNPKYGLFEFKNGDMRLDITGHIVNGFICLDKVAH